MIQMEFYESLDRKTIDVLWNQGVDMDDWDYLLFIPKEYESEFYYEDDEDNLIPCPTSYNVERLLQGCCANKWHLVTDFKGRKGIVGVAYHA